MLEAPSLPPNGALPITRAHLLALGAMSLTMAVLSFFIGLTLGQHAAPPTEGPVVKALLDEEARTGNLEALLMRVEAAQAQERLVFPEELAKSAPPLPPLPDPDAEAPEVAPVLPPVDPIVQPSAPPISHAELAGAPREVATSDEVPASGWAIQVGEREDVADAERLVVTLRTAGLAAYHVEALVDGHARHRVRVGGYASQEAAKAALIEVGGRAGATDATITQAP